MMALPARSDSQRSARRDEPRFRAHTAGLVRSSKRVMNDEPGDDHRLCRFSGVFSSAPMRQVFTDENRLAQYLAVEAAQWAIDWPAIRHATARPN
jgi:hypothetical protein